jgi:DNA repair exonuclease SbcCD ATPase subunit
MASLTETAKAVLEGKKLQEGAALPTVGPISGGVSNPNPVDPSTASTANAKTLRPKSKSSEADPKHNEAQDLGGQTPTSLPSGNLGAAAAGGEKRDTSIKGSGSNAEPAKKLSAVAEEMEEDGEVVEESNELSLAERVKMMKSMKKMKDMEEARKCSMEEDMGEKEEKMKKMEEEIELSEELESFIQEGIEAGLSEEEILAAIDENFEFVSEETEEETVAEALETYEVDMAEHVNALLEGENLSEEFQAKATTIFEAAVKAKLEEEVALLEQAYAETLEERVEEIMEELASNVDDYLNYVVEQWIAENEVAVESALRSELTEDFISGLRSLFAEHYIDVPEEEVQVVEELSSTVEQLEAKLNEEIQRNVELTSMLAESRKIELAAQVCEGLTDTQTQKLLALVENVEYTDDETFVNKISTLRENYFPTSVKSDAVLDRVESSDPQTITEENLQGPMAKYVKALGKSLPK